MNALAWPVSDDGSIINSKTLFTIFIAHIGSMFNVHDAHIGLRSYIKYLGI